MALLKPWTVAVTPQDQSFYKALGARIAGYRKAQCLTQVDLAERLGISQQTLAHYEVGRLRVSVAMLPTIAALLAVSVDALIGDQTKTGSGKRGPTPKLQQQLEKIRELPRTKQRFVMQMLDTVIAQQASG